MPKKTLGINYFPFDVGFFSDINIKVLRAKYGNDGVMIYIYLLTVIYREGYYIEYTDDLVFIIADELGVSSGTVQQVLTFLCKRSLLNSKLLTSDTIITSDGIQRRWQEAVKVRAAKRPIEVGNYWLLTKDETIPHIKRTLFSANSENIDLNSENIDLNSENIDHKVKKSKVKYIYTHTPPISPKVEWEDYEKVLSVLKETCPIIYNRHVKLINEETKISVIGEVNNALGEILQVYSIEELKEMFKKINQTYLVKPKYKNIDLVWVLNNIPKINQAIKEVEESQCVQPLYEVNESGVVISSSEEQPHKTKPIRQSKQEYMKAENERITGILGRLWQEAKKEEESEKNGQE